MRLNKKGFTLLEILLIVVVLGLAGALSWFGWNRLQNAKNTKDSSEDTVSSQQSDNQETNTAPKYIPWQFNGEQWKPTSSAPSCKEPYTISAPMDIKKANSVLYPGQVRGGDFKPHGGIGTEGVASNDITVTAVHDAYLYRGARYIEGGVVQYMFDFIDPCGFIYRLDHLAELSDEFAAYANTLPQPQPDDSRTTSFQTNPLIKQGTVVATKVGNVNTKNAFFDFGLFDLRQQNEVSKTELYRADQLRISDKEQSFFAVCWFDHLPAADKETVRGLPARGVEGTVSDYCK